VEAADHVYTHGSRSRRREQVPDRNAIHFILGYLHNRRHPSGVRAHSNIHQLCTTAASQMESIRASLANVLRGDKNIGAVEDSPVNAHGAAFEPLGIGANTSHDSVFDVTGNLAIRMT
jgi:hypothetical protein